MSFGQRLKYFRTIKNVTQQDLAEYLQVSRSTIAGYETRGKEPDYKTLVQIADFFDISTDMLIRDTKPSFSSDNIVNDTNASMIIKRIAKLDSSDYQRMLDYLHLLENQKSNTDNKSIN